MDEVVYLPRSPIYKQTLQYSSPNNMLEKTFIVYSNKAHLYEATTKLISSLAYTQHKSCFHI